VRFRPLSSSEVEVGAFGSVVEFVSAVLPVWPAEFLQCGAIGTKTVGNDPAWAAVTLECFLDEFQRCRFVAGRRNE
jgi:hypothetical protein